MANAPEVSSTICIELTCPGNTIEHNYGDDPCGYRLTPDGIRNKGDKTSCRRPYCAKEFPTAEARDKHEADPKPHRKADMDYICGEPGHADALAEHRFCPVCQ